MRRGSLVIRVPCAYVSKRMVSTLALVASFVVFFAPALGVFIWVLSRLTESL